MRLEKLYTRFELTYVPKPLSWLGTFMYLAGALSFFYVLFVDHRPMVFVFTFGFFGMGMFLGSAMLLFENQQRQKNSENEFYSRSKNGMYTSPDYRACQISNAVGLVISLIPLGIFLRAAFLLVVYH